MTIKTNDPLVEQFEPEYCFYCDAPLRQGEFENDHFPIPQRHSGTVTVPACLSCHSAKDRISLSGWSVDWISEVWSESVHWSRVTKLFFAKMICFVLDAQYPKGFKVKELPNDHKPRSASDSTENPER
jgi:hypothetical protein